MGSEDLKSLSLCWLSVTVSRTAARFYFSSLGVGILAAFLATPGGRKSFRQVLARRECACTMLDYGSLFRVCHAHAFGLPGQFALLGEAAARPLAAAGADCARLGSCVGLV